VMFADGSSGPSALRSDDDCIGKNSDVDGCAPAAPTQKADHQLQKQQLKALEAAVEDKTASSATPATSSKVRSSDSRMPVADELAAQQNDIMHMLAGAEEFKAAALVRKWHSESEQTVDHETEVLWRLNQFYDAFRGRNLKIMTELWYQADVNYVRCLHPSDRPSVGYKNIIKFWCKMFRNKDFSPSDLEIEDRTVHVYGTTAVVTCTEKLKDLCYYVTIIFRFVAGKWLLVQRHVSSPLPGELVLPHALELEGDHDHDPHFVDEVVYTSWDEDDEDDDESDADIERRFMQHHRRSQAQAKKLLRKETLSALRQIADTERNIHISKEEYLTLVHMMLESKPGESIPERAYDLLLHQHQHQRQRGTTQEEDKEVPDSRQEILDAWLDFLEVTQGEARKVLKAGRR